jgi:hypothetical protein
MLLRMRFVSKPLSVSIERPAALVYEFFSLPENFLRWASNRIAETAEGPVSLSFSERNSRGVLDYALQLPGGRSVYVPLRVLRNGEGCELVLTLFRFPEMSDQEFAAATEGATRDLRAAKGLLEAQRA